MAMEARPQTALILILAQLLFGFFMELLNGMATMRIVDQLLQRSRGRQVAPVELALFGLPTSRPLAQQPADMGLALSRQTPGPYSHKLLAQPALGAMAPADGAPLALGQRRQHLIGPLACRRAATLGTHLKITPHGHHVAFVARLQSSQESGVVALVGVGYHTAVRHTPGACLIQKRQSNLRLGLERHVSGYPGPFQARWVGGPGL